MRGERPGTHSSRSATASAALTEVLRASISPKGWAGKPTSPPSRRRCMREARRFPGRLGLQQRVLPAYRSPFFDLLAGACQGGLSVFAGEAREQETILAAERLEAAQYARSRNRDLFSGAAYLCLQPGLVAWLERWGPHALILEAHPRPPSNLPGSASSRAPPPPP